MTPERWQQIERLFQEARALDAAARKPFLTAACAGDEELRRQVEVMLSADSQPDALLDRQAYVTSPELFSAAEDQFQSRLLSQTQSPDEPAADALAGQCINGYQLLREIGRGGMGEVHLAYDIRLRRHVSLKLLLRRFTSDPERVSRFEREARAASALNHPNILTIYDFGEQDGRHYIASEYVEGRTLRAVLKGGPPAVNTALDIVIQIAGALTAAHQAGIVHRDIKPENVMLRPDGYVKVLDFGLAKLTEHTFSEDANTAASHPNRFETRPGVVLGTANYMSPEQARGQEVDARSDLFSLGVVLYELLTGKRPFTGATRNHVLVAILDKEPPPLTATTLQPLLDRALHKERDNRYASAAEMLAALQQAKKEWEFAEQLQGTRTSGALAVATSDNAAAHTVSSAEYLIGEFKQNKRVALAVLLAILSLI
ncbi:MAG TPA: serine/threonine-protein kinase, partial [Blastocatellia bacterium]|nr:serine/threonine-protein kinase [Blastocatellia bacterium]